MRIVTITSGLYRGTAGYLRRSFMVNGVEWCEVETYHSIFIVRFNQLDICPDDSERRAVDEALRDEQIKRGLR